MYLFKAKQAASSELERACREHGITIEQLRDFLAKSKRFGGTLHKAPHAYAGTAADLVAEVAPYLTQSRFTRVRNKALALVKSSSETARKSPHMVVSFVKSATQAAPEVVARVKEDVATYREVKRAEKAKKKAQPAMEAAAE